MIAAVIGVTVLRVPARPLARPSLDGYRLTVSDNQEFSFGFTGFERVDGGVEGQILWRGTLEGPVPLPAYYRIKDPVLAAPAPLLARMRSPR